MKIGYISKYFYPVFGGAENNIYNLAKLSVKNGHEVHVYTGNKKNGKVIGPSYELKEGIHIHRSRFLFNFTYYFSMNPSLLLDILKNDFDLIHQSSFGFMWFDFVLILKRILSKKTKFINTPHGPFMALSNYNLVKKIIKVFFTKIQKIYLGFLYDYVIEVNTFQWQWIVSLGIPRERIVFVPNGISNEIIDLKIKEDDIINFKNKYKINDERIISYLGRISEYKGIQYIIQILKRLNNDKRKTILLVMGQNDGYVSSLKDIARKLGVSSFIRFIIDIPETEKFVGLKLTDIFVLPSEWEAFGIVLLEAMSRGCVVLSSRTEGGNFLVTENINGFLFEHNDYNQLFELINYCYSNRKLMKTISENNIAKATEFSWENIYNNYYSKLQDSLTV